MRPEHVEFRSPERPGLILLLGRTDSATDGVEDYSQQLAAAVREIGRPATVVRLRWDKGGWIRALSTLRGRLRSTSNVWVLVQFTSRAWSRTLFTSWILVLGRVVHRSGCRFGVTVHDPFPMPGTRLRDRVRRRYQAVVLRCLARTTDAIFTTLDPALVPWSASGPASRRVHLLPTGSAVPSLAHRSDHDAFAVGVFCVSEPKAEAEIIAGAVRGLATTGRGVRLLVFGRNAPAAESILRPLLRDSRIDLVVEGLLPVAQLSDRLSQLDVMLFVRHGVSSRRSTVAAGLAHGLPIVGFRSFETGRPLTDAGILLAEPGDVEGLARHLEAIASDPALAADLRARSAQAYRAFFSWEAIVNRLDARLRAAEKVGA